jgi:NAD(P)-dependent dehydrogenase (short-subunit alcohol dehydrogenase family)
LAAPPHNYAVILACRNHPEKGQQAQEMISTVGTTHYLPLDLASKESIQYFCQQLQLMDNGAITRQGLNLLVNNAGLGWGQRNPYIQTKDGLEEIVGVNHFGTFYLTYLLLDNLKRAAANKKDDAWVVVVLLSLHDPNSRKKKSNDDDDNDELLLPDFPIHHYSSRPRYLLYPLAVQSIHHPWPQRNSSPFAQCIWPLPWGDA